MDLPQPISPELLDPSGQIIADVVCRRCGYNLRGLRPESRCPECATPIGLSTHGDLLRYADPGWVDKLARGIKYMLLGIVLGIFAGIAGGILTAISGAGPVLTQTIALLGGLVGLYGAWLLTTADPSGIGEDRYVTARRIVRFALLAGLLSQILQIVHAGVSQLPEVVVILLLVLIMLAGLSGAAGDVAKYFYLERLARRIPDPQLAGRARFLKWALGITMGLGAVIGGAAALVAITAGAPVSTLVGTAGPNAPAGAASAAPAPAAPPALRGVPGTAWLGVAGLGCVFALALLVFSVMALSLQIRLWRRFREQAAIARSTWAAAAKAGP